MAGAGLSRRDGLFILAGVAGAGFVWSGLQLNPEHLYRQLIDQDALAHEFDAAASAVLKETLTGTPLANRYRVNQPPEDGFANVLIFSAKALPQQAAYGGIELKSAGCLFTGSHGLVLIDADFLHDFLPARGFYDGGPVPSAADRLSDAKLLMRWVLGHEIGHLVHGDGCAHFGASRLDSPARDTTLSQARELGADQYFLDHLLLNPDLTVAVADLMMALINTDVRHQLGDSMLPAVGIIDTGTGGRHYRYFAGGSHPEFVIRAARLLELLGNKSGYEGMTAMAASFLRGLKEADR